MSLDTDLAELNQGVADLLTRTNEWVNSEIMVLAGTKDDPASFNASGGNSGELGYYPVKTVSGATVYRPSLDRMSAIATKRAPDGLADPTSPVAQTPLYDPNFGFFDGVDDTRIFPGASRAVQGLASVRHLGVNYEFIFCPAEETGSAVRIVQFQTGVEEAVAMSIAFTVNHHTCGAYSDGTDIYLVYAGGPYDDPSGEGEAIPNYNLGKSVSIMKWKGAATSYADVTTHRVFDDWQSAEYSTRYFNSSVTCSNDGKYIIFSANDIVASDRTNAASHVFIFERADIVAAGADARNVKPVWHLDMEHPSGFDLNCFQDLTCTKDPVKGHYYLTAFVGRIPAFAPQALLTFDLFGDGKPRRTIPHDGVRAKYGRAGLLNYAVAFPDLPDLGVPRSMEVEGVSYDDDGNLLTLTLDDWIVPGSIVTYGGQNYALQRGSSGYSADPSPSPTYWVLTTKEATSGAYTQDAVYTLPGEFTRRSKCIYKVAVATGADDEQALDGGIQVPRKTALFSMGLEWRKFDWLRGSDCLFGISDPFTNGWWRKLRLTDEASVRMYDAHPAANNNTYSAIVTYDRETTKRVLFCSRGFDASAGPALVLYPNDDPTADAGSAFQYTGSANRSIATDRYGRSLFSALSTHVPVVGDRPDSGVQIAASRAGVIRGGLWTSSVNTAFTAYGGNQLCFAFRADSDTTSTPTIMGAWDTSSLRRASGMTTTLGTASQPWTTIYATNPVIVTSDERLKEWRGGINEAERRAARRIAREIGIFQWTKVVAEQGADRARLHCGVRAQQAFAIMEDEGLDWQRYAWCCHDAWDATEDVYEPVMEPVMEVIVIPATTTIIVNEPGEGGEIRRVPKDVPLLDPDNNPIFYEAEVPVRDAEGHPVMRDTGEVRLVQHGEPAGEIYGVRLEELTMFILGGMAMG